MSDNYYLIIQDLPKEYIEKGYNKEVLQKYIQLHTSLVNNSDDKTSIFNLDNSESSVKIEVFGGALYINELVLFLREVFNKEKTISIQFGIDESKEIFYRGEIKNKGNTITIDKNSLLIENKTFIEEDINQLCVNLSIHALAHTHFRKIVSFYRFDEDQLNRIYDYILSGGKINKKNIAYFYRVYGNKFFSNSKYSEAEIKYEHALNIYDQNKLEQDKEYEKLVESYCLNLHRLGEANKALDFLESFKKTSKNIKALKAYILYDLGDLDKAEKLYEEALSKNRFTKDSIYGEYTLFTNKEAARNLLSIYIKKKKYSKAKKIAQKFFDKYEDAFFSNELKHVYFMTGENIKASKIDSIVYSNDIDFYSSEIESYLSKMFSEKFHNINDSIFEEDNNNLYNYYYGSENHSFLQAVYPNSRSLVREIINISKDTSLIKKAYSQYISINKEDTQIIKEYIFSQLKAKKFKYSLDMADSLINEQVRQKIFDEDLYSTKKALEFLNIGLNKKELISEFNGFKESFYDDTLYSKVKNPFFKSIMGTLQFIDDDSNDFDYRAYIKHNDSISNKNTVYSSLIDGYSAKIITELVMAELNHEFDISINRDSLIIESLKRKYDFSKTWICWGLISDLKGDHYSADQKYKKALKLDKNTNPYLEAADFFYEQSDFKNAALRYSDAISRINDTTDIDNVLIEKFVESYTLGYLEGDLQLDEYKLYRNLLVNYDSIILDNCFYQTIYLGRVYEILGDIDIDSDNENNHYEKEFNAIYWLLKNASNNGYDINLLTIPKEYQYPSLLKKIEKLKTETSLNQKYYCKGTLHFFL